MRIFGITISREKAAGNLSGVTGRGWWPLIKESYAGAWQQGVEVKRDSVLAHHAVFACQTLIASDIAKLGVRLVQKIEPGVWQEATSPAYSPVLRKPNAYQTRIQFIESWVLSKLQFGNAYILKQRDGRGVVVGLHVLSPQYCRPLIADNGDVYYEVSADALSGVRQQITIPAREIIHDRYNCLFHPLVGLSPIFANGLAATQGLAAQESATKLFQNGARPGGLLTAPGAISDETAQRLKDHWDNNYSGVNAGKVAVLGDGLKYEAMTMKSVDAQLVEQLKWSAEVVASTYHIPLYKVNLGPPPTTGNIQSLNVEYHSQALQRLIEDIELCLDDGLGIGDGVNVGGTIYGVEIIEDGLFRMDSLTQMEMLDKARSVLTLDERRARLGSKAMPEGGDTVYLQQQDHSLAAIAARDKLLIEQSSLPTDTPAPVEAPPAPEKTADVIDLWAVRQRAKGSIDARFRRAG